MAGIKRKRNVLDSTMTPSGGVTDAAAMESMPKITTGKGLRDAILTGTKDALRSAEYQIRIPHSQQPVSISHPTILLLQSYLTLSPNLSEIFSVWRQTKSSARPSNATREVEAAIVHLLASIIGSLTPVPFFQATLEGLAERMLEGGSGEGAGDIGSGGGGGYMGWLNNLISSPTRDLALPGLSLASALLNISTFSSTISSGFNTVPTVPSSTSSSSRLNNKIWSSLLEGGIIRSLPKLLSMRRKGGFPSTSTYDPLDKPDIRQNSLSIILPLISSADQTFLSGCKPLLSSIFSNLMGDPGLTIIRVLAAIWTGINSSTTQAVNRRTAAVLLTEQSVEAILKLYARDGEEDIIKGIKSDSSTTIADVAHTFLMAICTNPGTGICFPDNGWYKSKGKSVSANNNSRSILLDDSGSNPSGEADPEYDGNPDGSSSSTFVHNRVLQNVIRKIGARVVDDGKVAVLVEGILGSCPELVAGYWPYSGLSLDPKLSAKWIATISFIGRVIASPIPYESTFRLKERSSSSSSLSGKTDPAYYSPKLHAPPLQALVEAILPSPLSKHQISKGLQGSVGLIQHLCALTLARALQKLGEVQALLLKMGQALESEMMADTETSAMENSWFTRSRELELEMRKRVPDVPVIVTFAQRSAASQALQASLEETDQASKAKAELLTESALRLFQLYYETLPAMASELKFDVGKLLVSSSNARQEAEFRRENREGSVLSDTGSVASMGTVGTIGMGGGFGQARGDVVGFDALSQMHVLELLVNVKEWSWTSKASGSTHSYLFHVLQLYLATPHSTTKSRTRDLLQDMIGSSILFEHDPHELALWLQALPGTRDPSIPAPAALVLYQTHLLDFLDDCARRCMKTPFRYAELAAQFAEGTESASRADSRPSLLIFAVFEQLEAKIGGHHISSDGALSVILFVKLLALLLLEKGVGSVYSSSLITNLRKLVDRAAEKRGADLGTLRLAADSAEHQILEACGTLKPKEKHISQLGNMYEFDGLDRVEVVRWQLLRDGASLALKGLQKKGLPIDALDNALAGVPLAMTLPTASNESTAIVAMIRREIVETAPSDRLLGFVRVGLHMFQVHQTASTAELSLDLLSAVIETASRYGKRQVLRDITALLAGNGAFVDASLKSPANDAQKNLRVIFASLSSAGLSEFSALARPLLDAIFSRDGSALSNIVVALGPVYSLLSCSQSAKVANALIESPGAMSTIPRQELKGLLESLSSDVLLGAAFPLVESTGLYNAAALAVRRSATISGKVQRSLSMADTALSRLLSNAISGKRGPTILLRAIATKSFTLRRDLEAALIADFSWSQRPISIAPLLATLSTGFWDTLSERKSEWLPGLVSAALTQSGPPGHTAGLLKVLRHLGRIPQNSDLLGATVQELVQSNKLRPSPDSLRFLQELISAREDLREAVLPPALDAMLKWMIKHVTGAQELDIAALATLKAFVTLTTLAAGKSMSGYFAEPILTSIIQDRLDQELPVLVAVALCEHADLKASVIRQHLQLLFDSPAWRSLSRARAASANRTAVMKLVKSLFFSSPYISCQPAFIDHIINHYGGTTHSSDTDLLEIFQLFEKQTKTSATSILCRWRSSSSAGRTSSANALEAIKSLDSKAVFATCILAERKAGSYKHPVTLSSEFCIMDDRFLLALFGAFLHGTRSTGLDWVEVLRSGIISIAIIALASRDDRKRALGSGLLATAFKQISAIPFYEQAALIRLLRLVRHATNVGDDDAPERLPFALALFLAHAIRSIAEPASFLYPLTSRFLLQRPTLDVRDLPMLYGMLYASGQNGRKERRWMARFVRDAVRGEMDWRILQRRHTFSLLASISETSLDANLRHTVLQAILSITFLPTATSVLVEREGLLEFLRTQQAGSTLSSSDIFLVLAIAENVIVNMSYRERLRKDAQADVRGEAVVRPERMRRWVPDVAAVLVTVSKGADNKTLFRLSELCLRLAIAVGGEGCATLIEALTMKLRVREGGEGSMDYGGTIDNLFRAGTIMEPSAADELNGAEDSMRWLMEAAVSAGGNLGEWAAAELCS